MALRLDPELGDAYTSLGRFEYHYKWNWQAGEQNFERARELHSIEPNGDNAHATCLLAVGRFDEAVRLSKKSSEADPLSRTISVNYGQIFSAAGRDQEAIEQLKKTIQLDPGYAAPQLRFTNAKR
jgi:tetratricopeptide (TPR) repeat protein